MKVRIITVGKKPNAHLSALLAEYEKRLQPFAKFEWDYIAAYTAVNQKSLVVQAESQQILKSIKAKDRVVLLDETGTLLSNHDFAEVFDRLMTETSEVTFIIGGAYGVSDEVKQRADVVWSLSPLVFPHQLVRLLLIEQLYRTYTIRSGHPYHHQ